MREELIRKNETLANETSKNIQQARKVIEDMKVQNEEKNKAINELKLKLKEKEISFCNVREKAQDYCKL